jgi:hypothetical protein
MLSPSSTGKSFATLTHPLPVRQAQAQGDASLYKERRAHFRK